MMCARAEIPQSASGGARTRHLVWLAAVTVLTIAGCGGNETDPERELRQWVADMESAAEAKDRRAMLDRVSPDYADAHGNDRQDIGDRLRVGFLRRDRVALVSTIGRIAVVGSDAAVVDLTVAMAGTAPGTFGLSADAYRFELELEKPGRHWMLIGARWGEVGRPLR